MPKPYNQEDIVLDKDSKPDGGTVENSTREVGKITEHALVEQTIDSAIDYFNKRETLNERLRQNERYYSTLQWEEHRKNESVENAPEPTSNYVFSVLLDRHADMMDNIPSQNILPRDDESVEEAENLKQIIPRILEMNEYLNVYSDKVWNIIKYGFAIEGVLFDPREKNGLGEIVIKNIDPMSFFWQPGVSDLQDSENIFVVGNIPKHKLESEYPEFSFGEKEKKLKVQNYPTIDGEIDFESKKDYLVVIDRYYYVNGELHFCKVAGRNLLYSTELDDNKGFDSLYADNKYPFIVTQLWKVKNSLAGFGFVDVLKKIQQYVDKMDQSISINTVMHSISRYFIRENTAVDEDKINDWSLPFVKVGGSQRLTDIIKAIEPKEMPAYAVNHRKDKIDEMKEISGSNEFSRGETGGGVTAAAAIKALQEAGNKISRDILKSVYHSHKMLVYKIIERIREFYTEPRTFRIAGDDPNSYEFVDYKNDSLVEKDIEGVVIKPDFDIKVEAEKSNPFSQMANNELAVNLYQLGFFNPEKANEALIALSMMDFEGIDDIKKKIEAHNALMEQIQILMQNLQGAQPQGGMVQ